MKLLLFLLFPLIAFAQNDSIADKNISVISAEKMNVVYRGIDNPIKIAVPGAVRYDVSVSSVGIHKLGENIYGLIPGSGNIIVVSIDAIMQDGNTLHEEKDFRVLHIPVADLQITGKRVSGYHVQMTREELCKAKLDVYIENFLFGANPSDFYTIRQFNIKIIKKRKTRTHVVEGDTIPDHIQKLIMEAKVGDLVLINDIKGDCHLSDGLMDKMPMGAIEIISGN